MNALAAGVKNSDFAGLHALFLAFFLRRIVDNDSGSPGRYGRRAGTI
jgi:hypothetical protein